MDRRWMSQHRCSREYRSGVDEFIELVFRNASNDERIICPCVNCSNCFLQTSSVVREHLVCDGFLKGYTRWVLHGEEFSRSTSSAFSNPIHNSNVEHIQPCDIQRTTQLPNNITMLLRDALGVVDQVNEEGLDIGGSSDEVEDEQSANVGENDGGTPNLEKNEFETLLDSMGEELYPGCTKFSKLTFILHLYHLKCLNRWTNKSFTMLLELLIDAFPEGVMLPKSYYESKKIVSALGLDYEKIHSCPNHCMLFRGDRANDESCHICGASRWDEKKGKKNVSTAGDVENCPISKKKPTKILRYFPLIPRLQRLFCSTKTSNDMRWHEEGRKKDGLLRHPADGEAWKAFDVRYPDFASDARNVRLALSSDGFNPYRTMSTSYSTWPVVLVTYNMPPWSCMKRSSFMLSMIIPGEKGPGNNIDTYLQPLIEELNQLWEGVDTYDASSKQNFKMRAALMWTINDFPAYAYLSGWSTKGKLACPCCAESTCSEWLRGSGKQCYWGHRQWLPDDHPFRFQKEYFDGKEEHRKAPIRASGSEVAKQLNGIEFTSIYQRKNAKKRKRGEDVISLYDATHKKKDGSYIDDNVRELMDKAFSLQDERSEGSTNSNMKDINEKIFQELMGKEHNGRVRGLGLGPTPRNVFGVQSYNIGQRWNESTSRQELESLRKLVQMMSNKYEDLSNKYEDLSNKYDNLSNKYDGQQ